MSTKLAVFIGSGTGPLGANRGLWVTDGTAAGTSELTSSVGGASDFVALGSEVLFSTGALWVTDGTSAGTSDLSTVNGPGNVSDLAVLGNRLLFDGANSPGAGGLWVTDGTAAGTSELNVPGANRMGLGPQDITAFGTRALLVGDSATTGNPGLPVDLELWITDGTAAGTSAITSAAPGRGPLGATITPVDPRFITVAGNKAFFEGTDPGSGQEVLWVTDGTPGGTSDLGLKLVNSSGAPDLLGASLVALGNKVLFDGGPLGSLVSGLFVSDGTGAGTSELNVPALAGIGVQNLFAFGSKALFVSSSAIISDDQKLWVTDGTSAGTSELSVPGLLVNPVFADFTLFQNRVLFQSNSFANTTGLIGLWVTDGTAAGTSQLIAKSPEFNAQDLTVAGSQVLFDGTTNIPNLWVTDGTTAGSSMLNVAGASPIGLDPQNITAFAGLGTSPPGNNGGNNNNISPISNGNGNTFIGNGGNDTITSGVGNNLIVPGSGNDLILSNGNDVLFPDTGGSETVFAAGHLIAAVGAGTMFLVNGSNPATVIGGGSGSVVINGGAGGGLFAGGTGGTNVIFGGTGQSVMFGSSGSDLLFAGGANADLLIAGSGNETLSGLGSTGANVFYAGSGNDLLGGGAGTETFFAGHGASTVIGGTGGDVYGFINGFGGGSEVVFGFSAAKGDVIALQGYGANEAQTDLANATVANGSTTLTLSDNTSVTFIGVTGLTAANFV